MAEPAPTTRARRRRATREAVLRAARSLFFSTSYQSTSLQKVAEHAGYTYGAVLGNFESKPMLAARVLDIFYAEQLARLYSIRVDDPGQLGSVLTRWSLALINGNPGWMPLELSLTEFAPPRTTSLTALGTVVGSWIHETSRQLGTTTPASTGPLLISVLAGLAASHPNTDTDIENQLSRGIEAVLSSTGRLPLTTSIPSAPPVGNHTRDWDLLADLPAPALQSHDTAPAPEDAAVAADPGTPDLGTF